ncbi:MAG: hypothetical protein K8R92_11500 [Planctomycetes bacterium]|nr:hypothetical protein [Planctomycetota bacterium]
MTRIANLGACVLVALCGSILPRSAAAVDESKAAQAVQEAKVAGKLLSTAEALKDIDILQAALEEAHPGVHRYTPKAELDARFDAARKAITRPMESIELYRILAPVVAAVKCAHTSLLPAVETTKKLNSVMALFPFAVRVLGDEVYLTSDFTDDAGKFRGARLVSVNGRPAKELLAILLSSVTGDGDSRTAGRGRLADQLLFSKRLYTMAGIESPFRIEMDVQGKKVEATVEGIPFPKLQERAEQARIAAGGPTSDADYRAIGSDTAVLRLGQFSEEINGKPGNAYLNEVFRDLAASDKKTLILDVRNNGGGSDELGAQLFAHCVNQPFQYYRDLVVNKLNFDFWRDDPEARPLPEDFVQKQPDGKYRLIKHPNWGELQPAEPYFGGRVIILVNSRSYSTTCEFLAKMQDSGRATLIGEETGGGFSGNTSGPGSMLTLPNSKLRIEIHLVGYYMAVGDDHDHRRGVLPNVETTYTINDILKGSDLELEAALKLAGQN